MIRSRSPARRSLRDPGACATATILRAAGEPLRTRTARRRRVRTPTVGLFLGLALTLTCFVPTASTAQEARQELPLDTGAVPFELDECRELRRFDAATYWFWDAYFGVTDEVEVAGEQQGRLSLDEAVCFRISRDLLDDPVARTQGYREAVDQLIQWVSEAPDSDDDPGSMGGRARLALQQLTGRRMDDGERWIDWWNANRAYVWSADSRGRLRVVEAAKAARAPMDEDALILDAEEYWFYEGRGWISRLESRGEYLLGEVLIPPHGYGFRAHAAEIDDRGAKESGYLLALENLMVDGLMAADLPAGTARDLMARARDLTDQRFDSPEAWVHWWRRHQDRLELAVDGQRLVAR